MVAAFLMEAGFVPCRCAKVANAHVTELAGGRPHSCAQV